MQTVARIIELFGGLSRLGAHPIRLEVAGFMPLCIEHVGTGPRGLPLVSVAHYYEQNGDLMSDPDSTFEVEGERWLPVAYQQDGLGLYQEAVTRAGGEIRIDARLERELRAFAARWDANLADQGFLAAAQERAARPTPRNPAG